VDQEDGNVEIIIISNHQAPLSSEVFCLWDVG